MIPMTLWLKTKIARKGLVLVAVPVVFEIIFVLVLLLFLVQLDKFTESEQKARDTLAIAHDLGGALLCGGVYGAGTRIAPDSDAGEWHRFYLKTATEDLALLESLPDRTVIEIDLIRKIRAYITEYTKLVDAKTGLDSQSANLNTIFNGGSQASLSFVYKMQKAVQEIVRIEENKAQNSLQSVRQEKALVKWVIYTGLIISFILTGLLSIYFSRDITTRIRRLADNALSLGKRQRLKYSLGGEDEIAELNVAIHKTDDELSRLEKARKEILAFVSHELKTPLTALSSTFALLSEAKFQTFEEAGLKKAKQTKDDLAEVNSLITDLIDIERMEGGKFPFLFSDVDLVTLVAASVKKAGVESAGTTVDTNNVADLVFTADKERLCRALTNLIKVRSGTRLEIHARAVEKSIEICIKSESSKKLESSERYVKETVPLLISKMIVEQHGGTFTVENDAIYLLIPDADIGT